MKHVHFQDESSNLSKQILSQQMSNNWNGLSKAALLICEELKICGLFDPQINKKQFKTLVKKACQEANDYELYQQILSYKKMAALRDEIVKGNKYFFTETLKNVRVLFRFRAELYESKMNFKQKYRNEGYMCDSCESESDVSTHVLFCPAYAEIRKNKSLNSDSDLCEYLNRVLEIRTELRLNR